MDVGASSSCVIFVGLLSRWLLSDCAALELALLFLLLVFCPDQVAVVFTSYNAVMYFQYLLPSVCVFTSHQCRGDNRVWDGSSI